MTSDRMPRMHRRTGAKRYHTHCKCCDKRLDQPISGRFKEFCDDYCRKTYHRIYNSYKNLGYAQRLVARHRRHRAFRPDDPTDEKPQVED